MKILIKRILGKVQTHSTLADIKGMKSGGVRDSNKVDWRLQNGWGG